ncbi:hypothetical protein CNEO4_740038 [Clostridium neonatale]|nr:hypothetical protein CNEO2_220085 [Clostridium neonatale]CAI3208255.1 hypothetical protein CNEO2_640003 [Clostridium neonatale]CAI3695274.1 hypothetical protein CNEO4_740038 [Clostridium neonatale]
MAPLPYMGSRGNFKNPLLTIFLRSIETMVDSIHHPIKQ